MVTATTFDIPGIWIKVKGASVFLSRDKSEITALKQALSSHSNFTYH